MHPDQSNSENYEQEQSRRDKDLEALEERLRSHEPRAPQLDLAAIEAAAESADQHVVLPPTKSRHTGRLAGTIAVSWTCGAIAGALVMLVALRGAESDGGGPDTAVTTKSVVSESPADAKPDDRPKAPAPASSAIVSRKQLAASLRMSTFVSDIATYPESSSSSALRAGDHLAPFALLQLEAHSPHSNSRVEKRPDEKLPADSLEAQPTPTRDHLLREFLGNNSDSVL